MDAAKRLKQFMLDLDGTFTERLHYVTNAALQPMGPTLFDLLVELRDEPEAVQAPAPVVE
jgi:hypothetical protein